MGLLGVGAGLLLGSLVPLGTHEDLSLPPSSAVARAWSHVGGFAPLVVHGGTGLAITGSL